MAFGLSQPARLFGMERGSALRDAPQLAIDIAMDVAIDIAMDVAIDIAMDIAMELARPLRLSPILRRRLCDDPHRLDDNTFIPQHAFTSTIDKFEATVRVLRAEFWFLVEKTSARR